MLSIQTKNKKNAGFTLVEIMVVILIITILVAFGNWGNLSQKREKTRLEEMAVQLISMIDHEKTSALLGKTESSGNIVRKRRIKIDFTSPDLLYTFDVNLAKNAEDVWEPGTTKAWNYNSLSMQLWNCDVTPTGNVGTFLTMILRGDTMSFDDALTSDVKHIVIQVSRLSSYREIHIDRRTGVTYEREGTSTVSCSQ